MNEKMLRTMIDAAAVKRARIIANGSRFHVEVDAPGKCFTIETGRGGVRTWTSIDSAAKWLRGLGIGQVALDLAYWSPGQKSLL